MKVKSLIIAVISFLFFLLGFYHIKFREVFLVKAGTSHFLSSGVVGILSYLLPVMSFATAILFWFKGSVKIAAATGIFLCLSYALYIVLILIKGDPSCDCANIFPEIGYNTQLVLWGLPLALCIYLISRRENINKSDQPA